jgi:tRNA threonylcarbamoyl adenosine modification protein YeaZ
MDTLVIETATEKAIIVLVRDGAPMAFRSLIGDASLSTTLALNVKNLLDEYAFLPQQVAVGTGPGSFTGLRVGASLGRALAYGWRVPLIGIGSLDGFAPPQDGPFVVLLDARSGGFYVLQGERSGNLLQCASPCRLAPEALPLDLPIGSPHPHLIQRRLPFVKNIFETSPDPVLLSSLLSSQKSQSPLEAFSLSYLSSP